MLFLNSSKFINFMSDKQFVHLHVHSHYSLLDGLAKPVKYAEKAKEHGSPAIALTDHGVMYGGIEMYKACKNIGIKPILGCEMYLAFNKLTDKRHQIDSKRSHILLLAENQKGYENLLKMATIANLEGYYYKPRIDWDLLKKHSEGLIATSACLAGDIPQAILNEDEEKLMEYIERFQTVFGKENFYLELQHHPFIPQQGIVNKKIIELSRKLNIPLVATNDCHYVEKEDNEAQDIMLCIQTARNLDDSGRMSMMNSDYSLRSPEEMWEAFSHVPDALENTVKIAERCNVDFEFGKYLIPVFPVPKIEGKIETETDFLKRLCYDGLFKKYKISEDLYKIEEGKVITKDAYLLSLVERLEFELKIIIDMGFVGYFLIVWDFVNWAKEQNIIVGPGRGSAAGAIVSYALDITEIDPLKYNLLFERFLNPSRISMPDIDLDFADNRRDEVIDYVASKYGRDRVAQICTFGTMAARAAVKDVGRVLGVPFSEMNDFAKLIPEKPGTKLTEALEQSPELKEAVDNSDIFKQVMDNALKLEGAVRHVSVHACAVVIAPLSLTKYTALQHPPKDDHRLISQYEAKTLESLGLLKMDFLGLKNLTILQRTLKIIERTTGEKIDRQNLPIDDKKTYALLSRGETTGVFQLESSGMKRYLKELKPTEFEDIIAMVSLYRPGPMEWIPDYIKGKNGKVEVKYAHESLEPILRTTYGIAIYQEQILKIAQVFAGFSLGEADLLRRAIGKKIIKELEAQREKFIEGAKSKGHKESLAVMIFEKVIEPFAGYGFNKSHAACYAMIAYQTAYLKAHYPTQFMTALMSADYGNADRIAIEIAECDLMGINVLLPNINESFSNFTYVKDGIIRFGLSAIKGLGEASVKNIIEFRDKDGRFKNLEDFVHRVPSKIINKKTIESLAFGGAMDEFGDRKQIGLSYEILSEFAKKNKNKQSSDQGGLFDDFQDFLPESSLKLFETEVATDSEKLKWEKEYLGLYVSSHPLAGLGKLFKQKVILSNELPSKVLSKPIKVAGILVSLRKITTKKGDMMAIMQIEDTSGKIDCVVFPKTYQKYSSFLEEDKILFIEGILEKRLGSMQVIVKSIKSFTLEEVQAIAKKENLWTENEKIKYSVRLEDDKEDVENILSKSDVKIDHNNDKKDGFDDKNNILDNSVYNIEIKHNVKKDFFVKLKNLLKKYKGNRPVELLVFGKILQTNMKVNVNEEFLSELNNLIELERV